MTPTEEPTETMRDRIAIRVLEILLNSGNDYIYPEGMSPAQGLAGDAYAVADAMLKEREK